MNVNIDLELTPEELTIFDEISDLGRQLWSESLKVEGLNSDPKMFSIMLYKRLWSNHQGYTLLWKNSLFLEGDIVLRSGLEAAICIAANAKLKSAFVNLMRRDAAFSLQGQIKLHRAFNDQELVKQGESNLRMLQKTFGEGVKAAKLDWKSLAAEGGVPQLYDFHRMLSGVSSHVTGLSILKGVVSSDSGDLQQELLGLTKKMHLMMMAGATLNGSLIHSAMIESEACSSKALFLTEKLNKISFEWPGVGEQ